jgi:LEA14-like dessication related protein
MRKILLLFALCALSSGCTSLMPHLQPPQLKVVGLNVVGGDFRHQQLRLRIQVSNPNDREIAVRAIDYKVALAGSPFAEGSSAEPFTVPALGQSEFNLNANADLAALVSVVGAHLNDTELDYEVTGTLHLAEGLLREIPFKGHGKLPLH